jgi:aryl-alcohol dehydrogenase-like predicted oxidoreductase
VRKRPLGKTGIEVSELSLGTWGLSGDGYGAVVEAEVDRVLDRALELGIDLFDTADSYGKGAMERRLGERLPASGAYVVTKLGTDVSSVPKQKRFDLDHLRPAFEASRERLRRETLDVVLLHNPTMLAMSRTEAFDFLKELKRLGSLRAWGVSAGSLEVARAAVRHGADVVELAYNVFVAADLHELSGDVAEHGVAVLARSVLAHGLLAGQWSAEREFYRGDHRRDRWTPTELKTRISQLDALRPMVAGPILSVRAAALRFALANQLVSSAVLGPRSVAQLEQLTREAGEGPPYLRDTALPELSARLRAVGVVV